MSVELAKIIGHGRWEESDAGRGPGSNGLVGFLGVLIAGGVLDWFLGEVLSLQFCLMYFGPTSSLQVTDGSSRFKCR